MRILEFEWDDINILHLELGHGITPDEAEEVFAEEPEFRRLRRKRYAALGPTASGRFLALVFKLNPRGLARVLTGWDMEPIDRRMYERLRRKGGRQK